MDALVVRSCDRILAFDPRAMLVAAWVGRAGWV
jgi:hypothetical protein